MWRVQVSIKSTRLATTQWFLDFACLRPRTRDGGAGPGAALCALALVVPVAPRVPDWRQTNRKLRPLSLPQPLSSGTSMAESKGRLAPALLMVMLVAHSAW